jgi:hypothetical protein
MRSALELPPVRPPTTARQGLDRAMSWPVCCSLLFPGCSSRLLAIILASLQNCSTLAAKEVEMISGNVYSEGSDKGIVNEVEGAKETSASREYHCRVNHG